LLISLNTHVTVVVVVVIWWVTVEIYIALESQSFSLYVVETVRRCVRLRSSVDQSAHSRRLRRLYRRLGPRQAHQV